MHRILVADDEELTLEMIHEILKEDYLIEKAYSGKQALDKISQTSDNFDGILLDISMPEMNGIEACRKIREMKEYKYIPIIFITADNSHKQEKMSFEAGGSDFITKPILPESLQTRLKSQLALSESQICVEKILEKKKGEIRQYAFSISHELRRPIVNTINFIRLIEEKENDTETFQFALEGIHAQINELDTISKKMINIFNEGVGNEKS